MKRMRTVAAVLGLALAAQAEGPATVWSAELKGDQFVTPVEALSTVYAVSRQTPPPDGGSPGWLTAFDVKTGTAKWAVTLQSPHLAPAIDGDVVCVLDGDVTLGGDSTQVRGIDAATGKQLWSVSAAGPDKTYFTPVAPAAQDGRFFLSRGSTVVALEAKTGKELWTTEAGGRAMQLLPADGRLWAIVYGESAPKRCPASGVAFDATTGKELVRLDGRDRMAYGAATLVLCGYELTEAIDSKTLKVRWTSKEVAGPDIEMLGGSVMSAGPRQKFRALDLKTGKEERVLDATGQLGGNRIVSVGEGNVVTARSAQDGTEFWTWTAPARPRTPFALRSSLVYVICEDGKLYALRERGGR
jgi:outer membrane protein assembly factor BamB